jgi:hypothetical protein
MRTRSLAAALLLVGATTVAFAARGDGSPVRQWAITYLRQPTLIGSTIVQGPVMFVHDNNRMARGEPCTTVQLVDPTLGPIEEIAAFHCIPTVRPFVRTFTIHTRLNTELGYGCVLTEYQFAGGKEGHAVPLSLEAHQN